MSDEKRQKNFHDVGLTAAQMAAHQHIQGKTQAGIPVPNPSSAREQLHEASFIAAVCAEAYLTAVRLLNDPKGEKRSQPEGVDQEDDGEVD